MASKTEVAVQESGGLAIPEEVLEALRASQAAEIDSDMFQVPILKIGQALTREVQNDQAEQGEFINTLTGEGIGTAVDFIVAFYNTGRFGVDRDANDGRAFVTTEKTIPAHWADLVGEEFVGTPFTEHPDAEEQFKARVNRKEIKWGKGPKISTTHNFTGIALVEVGDEVKPEPVRLSLQRSNVPVVTKWLKLSQSLGRSAMFWDIVYRLGTEKKTADRGSFYNLTVAKGRPTTAEEKQAAYDLATFVMQGRVVDNSAADAAPGPAPEAAGGLAV